MQRATDVEPHLPDGVEEALELLLPGADRKQRDEAERVAGFLRLLQADARRPGGAVSVDLARAREDLAQSGRDRLEESLHDLCAHYVSTLIGSDRFLCAGTTRLSAAEAWRALESLRDEYDGLAELPAPNEALQAVAARLVESLARHVGEGIAAVWQARLVAALRGPREGESAFRALTADDAEIVPNPEVWAGIVECLLDRGAVHPAASLAEECFGRHPRDARLGRLLVWCRLLAGDVVGARALDETLGPWRGVLPGPLVRLRVDQPDWLPLLSGKLQPAKPIANPIEARLDRTNYGVQLIAVVQLHPGAGPELVGFDAAAAVRARVERWFEDREGAARRGDTPEHHLLRDAQPIAWHRDAAGEDARSLAHSLGGEDTRAALLQPILDEAGEVCGWLRFEASHHLLPSRAAAAALARTWRTELLRRRGSWESQERALPWSETSIDAREDDGVARVFADLVHDLGIKTARRAWWGFEMTDSGPQLVAHGGEGLGLIAEAPGLGRALRRALTCGGPVRGEEPDPGLYLHAQSAAGVVLCLCIGDVCIGALVIESERRRDFSAEEAERLASLADRWALALRLAQFRGDHLARFGTSVLADAVSPGFRAFHANLTCAAHGPAPLVLVGPAGSGKRVFARWAWFESATDGAPRLECTVAEWLANGARADAYLAGLEDLDASGQARLLRALEDGCASRRIAFGTREDPGLAAREGRLAPELGALLGREQLAVPGFVSRRDELLAMAQQRTKALAHDLGRPAPHFEDDALAFLWRQDWPGNWRELESRLHRLLRGRFAQLAATDSSSSTDQLRNEPVADGAVTADQLIALWRAMGDEPVTRLSSRKPPAALLRAALDATGTAGGRANKRRAALFLGWDPDTFAARLTDAGISAPDPERRGGAWMGDQA